MEITKYIPEHWRDLQNKVSEILSESGFDVEVQRKTKTVRGTVEIDVYAENKVQIPNTINIIECKNWNTAVPQEKIHAFYSVVQNIGANLGLLISKSGFQSGAYEAVKNTNIRLLSWIEFLNLFKEKWIKEKTKYLYKKSYELFDFTDYATTKYDNYFHALNKSEREQYIALMNLYGEVPVRCGLISPVDYWVTKKTKLFSKDYTDYEEYFDDLEFYCDEGIKACKNLLFKQS